MSTADSLAKLRRQLAALDEAALEALASRGLLRRARKDLAGGAAVALAGEGPGQVQLRVGACTVVLPETGPAHTADDDPDRGRAGVLLVSHASNGKTETNVQVKPARG